MAKRWCGSRKPNYSHFISVPLNTDNIKRNFKKFKESVLNNIDPRTCTCNNMMFQRPEKLHLTLCMLSLPTECKEHEAINTLYNFKANVIEPMLQENEGPIRIRLKGLACMQRNPVQARVLYAKIKDTTGLLQEIADVINEYYIWNELTRKERDHVLLHTTVINTAFYERKSGNTGVTFDATDILRNYEDVVLGEHDISTIHLSKLWGVNADGYFKTTSKIWL